MKIININTWKRKAQFEFFKNFDDPFFSATSNIDCTTMFNAIKNSKQSFFSVYMYCALKALNNIPEFKTRIAEDNVVQYDVINGTTTVFKKDETFSFCYFQYHDDFTLFSKELQEAISQAKQSKTLISNNDLNLVYVSVIPWRSFTNIKHPRSGNKSESVPRIVFGKVFELDNKFLMPVSIDAHHSLADGYHASLFFNQFEKEIQNTDLISI